MTPEQHELAIKYMMGRLPPEDQEELKTLLGGGDEKAEAVPDLVEDALKGRLSMDRLPDRLKQQMVARQRSKGTLRSADQTTEVKAMFPNADRLR